MISEITIIMNNENDKIKEKGILKKFLDKIEEETKEYPQVKIIIKWL